MKKEFCPKRNLWTERPTCLERRENDLTAKEAELKKKEKKVDELHDQGVQELERISGFTSEEAKEYLLKSVEDEVND